MTENEKKKRKFRSSSEWKKFRKQMYKLCEGKDALTGKPLRKGWQVHHLDQNPNNYKDLNPDHFVCLNRQSHETIHFVMRYDFNLLLNNLKHINMKTQEINNNGYSEKNDEKNE